MLSFVPINLHRCWPHELKHYIAAVCVKWKKEGLIFATPSSPVRSAQISSLKTSHSNNIMYQINPLNIYQKTNSITSENK